jgi:hypothetical protein
MAAKIIYLHNQRIEIFQIKNPIYLNLPEANDKTQLTDVYTGTKSRPGSK